MKQKLTVIDIIVIVVAVCAVFFASPYVIRQFIGLRKPLDIIWTISGDIIVLAGGALVLYVIDRLLNRYL